MGAEVRILCLSVVGFPPKREGRMAMEYWKEMKTLYAAVVFVSAVIATYSDGFVIGR